MDLKEARKIAECGGITEANLLGDARWNIIPRMQSGLGNVLARIEGGAYPDNTIDKATAAQMDNDIRHVERDLATLKMAIKKSTKRR